MMWRRCAERWEQNLSYPGDVVISAIVPILKPRQLLTTTSMSSPSLCWTCAHGAEHNNFVNVAEIIGRPVDRTTLQMNEEDFIKKSIDKHGHYPSVKLIHEHPEHQCKFEFKLVSPKEVETILRKLNIKKATGCDGLPPKIIKAAASAISAPLSSIVNSSLF